MEEAGGGLWFVIDVVLVGLLGLGIAYGVFAWRSRRTNPAIERARDEATHRAYEDK